MWLITKILLLICILQNILFWPTVYYSKHWIVALIALIFLVFNPSDTKTDRKAIIGLTLVTLLLVCDAILVSGLIPAVAVAVYYSIGICLFRLPDRKKTDLLSFITTCFSLITCVSLIAYISWLIFGYSHFSILKEPFGYWDYRNFLLFIIPKHTASITRFSSVFIEPGHFGMIATFLLFANKYDFKTNRQLIPILIGVLFSLSLAGYILLILGYALTKGTSIWKICAVSIICGFGYITVTYWWNNGDNPVYERIVKRLEYDENKGIAGNNRNMYGTEMYFLKMVDDGTIFTGVGTKKVKELESTRKIGGAGITMYLIYYGVIGLVLVAVYYWILAINSRNKRFALKFLLFIAICFLQRAYPSWIAWLLPFITSFSLYRPKIRRNQSLKSYENSLSS